jgi:hypothetical protein
MKLSRRSLFKKTVPAAAAVGLLAQGVTRPASAAPKALAAPAYVDRPAPMDVTWANRFLDAEEVGTVIPIPEKYGFIPEDVKQAIIDDVERPSAVLQILRAEQNVAVKLLHNEHFIRIPPYKFGAGSTLSVDAPTAKRWIEHGIAVPASDTTPIPEDGWTDTSGSRAYRVTSSGTTVIERDDIDEALDDGDFDDLWEEA